jgi:hypothetical protein
MRITEMDETSESSSVEPVDFPCRIIEAMGSIRLRTMGVAKVQSSRRWQSLLGSQIVFARRVGPGYGVGSPTCRTYRTAATHDQSTTNEQTPVVRLFSLPCRYRIRARAAVTGEEA